MTPLADLKARVLADGSIDDDEVALLRRELYADGSIDRDEAEFLVEVRAEATATCPAFDALFVQAIKGYVLTDGTIDAAEAAWLRQVLFADGTIDDVERRLLTELHTQAREVAPAFQQLFDECMK